MTGTLEFTFHNLTFRETAQNDHKSVNLFNRYQPELSRRTG